jgi:DNA (cytosine-5)-methyltransferase 1
MEIQSGIPGRGIVSFFAGCGILDLGFEKAGFRTWLANEIVPAFADAYEYARMRPRLGAALPVRGRVIRKGIEYFLQPEGAAYLQDVMAEARAATGAVGFIGGPPCPDFSIAGKQAGHTGDHGRLTQDYFDLIGIMRPDFFLFENVRGLKSTAKHREFFEQVLAAARDDGYEITERLVNAIDYGVPQDRHRVIVIGFHRDAYPDARQMAAGFRWEARAGFSGALKAAGWPQAEMLVRDGQTNGISHDTRQFPASLGAGLAELTIQTWFDRNRVDEHPNATDHFQVRSGMARMQTVLEGDTSHKSFKRLHRYRYSPTCAYGNNEVHLHPYRDRRLSAAEAMAIQTLPREYELPPASSMTLSAKFKTIGNGVPFRLAEALAKTIAETIGDRVAWPVRTDAMRRRSIADNPPIRPVNIRLPQEDGSAGLTLQAA